MNQMKSPLNPVDNYWTGACMDQSAMQSPINIDAPFSFMKLRIEGDFGEIINENNTFSSYLMLFKCPSEHSVGPENTFFPLEIQIFFIDSEGTRLNMAFLFNYDEKDSLFLKKLGFGKGVLSHLMQQQMFEVPETFSASELLPSKNQFFVYKGSDTRPPCHPAIWVIAYETLKISQAQIQDFPQALLYESRPIQKKKQEVFLNFRNYNQTDNTDGSAESDQQSDKEYVNSTQQEFERLIRIKDSFIILGDETIYDPYVYLPGDLQKINVKIIRNDDYIVIKRSSKEQKQMEEDQKTAENKEIQVDDEFVDEIINDLLMNDVHSNKFKAGSYNSTTQNKNNQSISEMIGNNDTIQSNQTKKSKKNSKSSSKQQANQSNTNNQNSNSNSNVSENAQVPESEVDKKSEYKQSKDDQKQSKDDQKQIKDEQKQSKDDTKQSKDEQKQSKDEQKQNKDEQKQSKDDTKQSKDDKKLNKDGQGNQDAIQKQETKINKDTQLIEKAKEQKEARVEDKKQKQEKQETKQIQDTQEVEEEEPIEDYAFNRNGEWDNVPIFNTSNWPQICKEGKKQSPVWIDLKNIKERNFYNVTLNYDYIVSNALIINDGIKLILHGNFGSLKYNNSDYIVQRINFHHPAQHLIGDDKMRTDMEIEIVHQIDKGDNLLILSIFLLLDDEPNQFLQSIDIHSENKVKIIPAGTKQVIIQKINLASLIQSTEHYISYEGSLASPPCTENVIRLLNRERFSIAPQQLQNFKKILRMETNVRGIHQLHGRQFKTH